MIHIRNLIEHNGMDGLLFAAGLAVLSLLVLYSIRLLATRKFAQKPAHGAARWDGVLAGIVAATHDLTLLGISLVIGLYNLELSPKLEAIVGHVLTLILLSQVGIWGHHAIRGWRTMQIARLKEAENEMATMHYSVVLFLVEAVLWIILTLMMLDNLGVNITTLVASLGIGGIAVALAVQNILGDILASLSIALNKPFVAGDFIVVDDMMGTVKHVGLKTTSIQSLSGEELIFSNTDLLKSRIRNYKRMSERRVLFQFGLAFDTPAEKLRNARDIIAKVVNSQNGVRLDRVHFKSIGLASLDFEVVYYVLSPDFTRYMDIQQAINLDLMERLAADGIRFSFPAQTLHIETDPAGSPNRCLPANQRPTISLVN